MNRNKRGQFARKTKYIVAVLLAGVAGAIVADYFYVTPNLTPLTYIAPAKVFAAEVKTAPQIAEELKKQVLDQMIACENPSNVPVWQDDNKAGTLPRKDKVSIGVLAFKISTVQRFYKKLHGTELTDIEATQLALDPQKARDLAIEAWTHIKGSINEWSCVDDGMKARVEDIRTSEQ